MDVDIDNPATVKDKIPDDLASESQSPDSDKNSPIEKTKVKSQSKG